MQTPGILTPEEAQQVLSMLIQQRTGHRWRDTNVNMASVSEADDGTVFVDLLGWTEMHASVVAFSRAYGLKPSR